MATREEIDALIDNFVDPKPDIEDDFDDGDIPGRGDPGKPPVNRKPGDNSPLLPGGQPPKDGKLPPDADKSKIPLDQAAKDAATRATLNRYAEMSFGKMAHSLLAAGGGGYSFRTNFKRRILCFKLEHMKIDLTQLGSASLTPDLHLLINSLYDPARHDRVAKRLASNKIKVPVHAAARCVVRFAGGVREEDSRLPDPSDAYLATIYNLNFLRSFFVKRSYTTNPCDDATQGNGSHGTSGGPCYLVCCATASSSNTPLVGSKCSGYALHHFWVFALTIFLSTIMVTQFSSYTSSPGGIASTGIILPAGSALANGNSVPAVAAGRIISALPPVALPGTNYVMTEVYVSGTGSLPIGWNGHVSVAPTTSTSPSVFPDGTAYYQQDIYVTAYPSIRLTDIHAHNNEDTAEQFVGGSVSISYNQGTYTLLIEPAFSHALIDHQDPSLLDPRALAGMEATALQSTFTPASLARVDTVVDCAKDYGVTFAVGVKHGTTMANIVALHRILPEQVAHRTYGRIKVSERLDDALRADLSVYARWLLMFRRVPHSHAGYEHLVADYAALDDPMASRNTDKGASMLYALTMLLYAPQLGGHLIYSGGFVPYCETLFIADKAAAVASLPVPNNWAGLVAPARERQLLVSDDLRSKHRVQRLDEAVALSSVSNLMLTMPTVFEPLFPAEHVEYIKNSGVPMPYISHSEVPGGGCAATAISRGLQFVAHADNSTTAMRDVLGLLRANMPVSDAVYAFPPAGTVCAYSTMANFAQQRLKKRMDSVMDQAALMFEAQPSPSDFEGDDRCNSQPSGALTLQANTGGKLNFFGVANAMSSYDPSNGNDAMIGRMNAFPRMLAAQSSDGGFWPYVSGSTVNGVPLCPNMPVSDGIMSSHVIMSGGNLGALVYALQPSTFTTAVFNGFENSITRILDIDYPRHPIGTPVDSYAAPLGYATPATLLRFLSSSLFKLPEYLSPSIETALPAWSVDSTLPATLTLDCPTAGTIYQNWLTIDAAKGMLLVNAVYGGTLRVNVANTTTVTSNTTLAGGLLIGTIWMQVVLEGSNTTELGTLPYTKTIKSSVAMYSKPGTLHEVGYSLAFDVPVTGFVSSIKLQVCVNPVAGITTSALTPNTAGGNYTVELSTFEPVKQLFPVVRDLVESTLAIVTVNSVFSTPSNVRTSLTMPVQKGNLPVLELRHKYEVSFADVFRHTGVQNVKKLLDLKPTEVVVPLDALPVPDHLVRARPMPGDETMSTGIVDTLMSLLPIVAPLAKAAFNHFAPQEVKDVFNNAAPDFMGTVQSFMHGHAPRQRDYENARRRYAEAAAREEAEDTAVRDRVVQRSVRKLGDAQMAKSMLEDALKKSRLRSERDAKARAASKAVSAVARDLEESTATAKPQKSRRPRSAPKISGVS